MRLQTGKERAGSDGSIVVTRLTTHRGVTERARGGDMCTEATSIRTEGAVCDMWGTPHSQLMR